MSKARGALVVLAALLGSYSLFVFANRGSNQRALAPGATATFAAPIAVSKLHVAKISPLDLHCNGAAAIAPDNEHYVCAGGPDSPGLWLGSFGKGLQKRLAENGGPPAAWLPNGKALVYTEIVRDRPTMLYEVDVETGERTAISPTTFPSGGDHLQVLPDGRVAFLEKGALQVWDSSTKTTKEVQAIGCIDPKTEGTVASSYTAVSPDGASVAEACAGSLYLIDVRVGKTITLSNQVGIFVKPMAWSPDGSQLAYSVQPDSTRTAELWLVNADGSSRRRLWLNKQARAFGWFTWMPDGQTLLFVNNPGGTSFGPGYVYMVISASGGPPKELFKNGDSLQLFDNGRKILISRSVEDTGYWIVDLAQ